ncbi:MAG TPA: efflux RND transporter periplasmic adaptor subunit [Vicinamibacterales bacterium]|nr:efflux RND transporter periplasmic adaptor subunit [Vicinamibacterales bacterium]
MTDLKDDLAALRLDREPDTQPRRRWIGWAVLAVLLIAAAGGAWWWLSRERPIKVEIATVSSRQAGAQAAVLNATGYVTARRRATVSSKITGKVVEVNIEEGMAVSEGQVLARLDAETQRASVALAEAQAEAARRNVNESEVRLNEARINLARMTKLVGIGYSTAAEVDAARAAADSFEARIRAAREQVRVAERQIALERTNLDSTIIRAPFAGVVISKDAQPGEMVSPVSAGGGFTRTGIGTIVDMRSLEVEVDVNESYINRVKPDQAVTAVLDAYPDFQIPARVITTIPSADRQKATVLVRIGLMELDPRILPDMGVKVVFLRDSGDAAPAARAVTLVPKAAIKTDGKQSYAFVVVNDRVDRRAITTGGADGDRVEVIAGLTAGERVVVSPLAELTAGSLVVAR